MIEVGDFVSHSGLTLPYKICCEDFLQSDWEGFAELIAKKYNFGEVYGIPRGGTILAECLEKYRTPGVSYQLIVDDVLTTGKSMEEAKEMLNKPFTIGVVIFSRSKDIPYWCNTFFWVDGAFG